MLLRPEKRFFPLFSVGFIGDNLHPQMFSFLNWTVINPALTHTHLHPGKIVSPTHIQPRKGYTYQKKVTPTYTQPRKVTLTHIHQQPPKKKDTPIHN